MFFFIGIEKKIVAGMTHIIEADNEVDARNNTNPHTHTSTHSMQNAKPIGQLHSFLR